MRLLRGRTWNCFRSLTMKKNGLLARNNSSHSSVQARRHMLLFLQSGWHYCFFSFFFFFFLVDSYLYLHNRRLELLARSGRFADSAAVLRETSSYSPEEAAIIIEVLKDLKQNSPDKVDEFAHSILAWLEMVCSAITIVNLIVLTL